MFIPLHDANQLRVIKRQYVTLAIIATNIVIWLFTATVGVGDASRANAINFSFGYIPALVNDLSELQPSLVIIPEIFSHVTYAFLHADFLHLAGNMLFLWVFGDNVEDAMGHFRFVVFYILCAAFAAYCHGLADPASSVPLIGASGATAGIVGAYLILHPRVKIWILVFGRIPLRLSAMWVLGFWIVFQVVSFLAFPESQISFVAHIGGFAAGAVLIFLFRKRHVVLLDRDLPPVIVPPGGSVPSIKAED